MGLLCKKLIKKFRDQCLQIWNFNSTLKGAIATILAKLEGGNVGINYGGNVGNFNQVPINTGVNVQNVNQNLNQNRDDDISNELVKDLNAKSLEELIYIYYNEEDYVYEFTNKLRESNLKAIQEIDALSGIILFLII